MVCSRNRDLKCNRIYKLPASSFCLGTFYDPYSSFLDYQFLHYLVPLVLCPVRTQCNDFGFLCRWWHSSCSQTSHWRCGLKSTSSSPTWSNFFIQQFILDNVKIGNLKRKDRDHKKVDEDAGNLQILLHLRSLFQLHGRHSICYYIISYVCIFTLLTIFK